VSEDNLLSRMYARATGTRTAPVAPAARPTLPSGRTPTSLPGRMIARATQPSFPQTRPTPPARPRGLYGSADSMERQLLNRRSTPVWDDAGSPGRQFLDWNGQAPQSRTTFSIVDPGNGGGMGLPSNNAYPDTPAPLSPEEIALFDARRRALDEALKVAETESRYGKESADTSSVASMNQLARDFTGQREAALASLTGAGLALSPNASRRAMTELSNSQAMAYGNVANERLQALAAMKRRVDDTRRKRQTGMADIAAAISARGADINKLLPGVAY
jgi:hypothetical protein